MPRTGVAESSWLLRLFKSEFFDSRLALIYLYRYPESVGIQHYICNELKTFPIEEIEDLLPQLCHLLLARPSDSIALEEFLLDRCEHSNHMAIFTLWHLQAYLSDLRHTSTSHAFLLCKKVYHRVQAIIFADTPIKNTPIREIIPGDSDKIRHHLQPALIGIGSMLAGWAWPGLLKPARHMAVMDGKRRDSFGIESQSHLSELNNQDESGSNITATTTTTTTTTIITPDTSQGRNSNAKSSKSFVSNSSNVPIRRGSPSSENDKLSISFSNGNKSSTLSIPLNNTSSRSSSLNNLKLLARIPTSSPSLEDLHKGSAFSFDAYVAKTSNATASLSRRQSIETSYEDFEIGGGGSSRHLERSHYFHSEMQFVMSLVEISERLRTVPKPARQSTLIAELSLLNHNLPADVCMPAWCPATTDNTHHHRVARIVLSDSVVLNSADRVPYLIVVEVIERGNNLHKSLSRDDLEMVEFKTEQPKIMDHHIEIPPPVISAESSPVTSPIIAPAPVSMNIFPNSSITATSGIQPPEAATIRTLMKSTPVSRNSTSSRNPSNDFPQSSPSNANNDLVTPDSVNINNSIQTTSPRQIPASPRLLALQSPDLHSRKKSTNVSSYEYYRSVLDRRYSASNIAKTKDQAGSTGGSTNSISELDEFAERMRTAAVMLAQLYQQQQKEASGAVFDNNSSKSTKNSSSTTRAGTNFELIKARIIKEMMALEEKRIQKGREDEGSSPNKEPVADEVLEENEEKTLRDQCLKKDKEDPSAAVLSESWETKKARIRASSPFGGHNNWRLLSVIVKSGADLRQEQLALQLLRDIKKIWQDANIPIWVHYYNILVTSDSSGLIETIRNAVSIHSIKKEAYAKRLNQQGIAFTLYDYFVKEFGQPGCGSFQKAQDNFMRSLAGYSIICYLLQIKDRHNGNILLNRHGFIIHIDFGFMLSNSPGSVGFELAPFKLPQEYLDVLGGVGSEKFAEFKALMKVAFLALQKKCENIVGLVQLMELGSNLPCFTGRTTNPQTQLPTTTLLPGSVSTSNLSSSQMIPTTSSTATSSNFKNERFPVSAALRERFQCGLTEAQVGEFIDKLVESSCGNIFTRLYDTFQYYAQGIL